MALKDTVASMKDLLACIEEDLGKAERGNKAAAQRVRVYSIEFEKVAKGYRKESVAAEKKGVKKAPAKKATAKMPKKK